MKTNLGINRFLVAEQDQYSLLSWDLPECFHLSQAVTDAMSLRHAVNPAIEYFGFQMQS